MTNRNSRSQTILCVDDDEHLRVTISQSLRSFGYHVIEADNYTRAEMLLRENEHGLLAVVSDYEMAPGPTGADLIREADRRHAKVGVYVLISGKVESDPAIASFLSERIETPRHFLPKPFHIEDLLSLLKHEGEL